mmetsp:Transcript_69420/g.214543  ORF Transcript_69420/g.214543 Transcript_69420/m.214543 type:complete len:207 (-) Transcript_69420:971-1591(-)
MVKEAHRRAVVRADGVLATVSDSVSHVAEIIVQQGEARQELLLREGNGLRRGRVGHVNADLRVVADALRRELRRLQCEVELQGCRRVEHLADLSGLPQLRVQHLDVGIDALLSRGAEAPLPGALALDLQSWSCLTYSASPGDQRLLVLLHGGLARGRLHARWLVAGQPQQQQLPAHGQTVEGAECLRLVLRQQLAIHEGWALARSN